MRQTGLFGTALAAALASLLGLGADGAVALDRGPAAYEAAPAPDSTLPVWLVRFKLRQQGYQDIYRVRVAPDGLVAQAHDRWGRHVKLLVDPHTGAIVPRPGYGLAHLRRSDVPGRLAELGYALCSGVADCDGSYQATALDGRGHLRSVRVDALTGAVWFAQGHGRSGTTEEVAGRNT